MEGVNLENIFFGSRSLFFESLLFVVISFGLIFCLTTSLFHLRKWFSVLFSLVFLMITAVLFYSLYLSPGPKIIKISPGDGETGTGLNRRIEVFFDRPVSRPMLLPTLVPEIPGRWVFEDGLIPKHLMRRLVFVPNETLPPDTEFAVRLDGIQNISRNSPPKNSSFGFKTQESPKIARIEPGNNTKNVRPDTKIEVYLTAPNGSLSQINFELLPAVLFEIKEDVTKTHLTLTPKQLLTQGTNYQLRITKSDLRRNLKTNVVVRTGVESWLYTDNFTVKEAAGVDSFTPEGDKVSNRQPVTIRFSRPMVEKDVRDNFTIFPTVEGSSLLIDGVIYVFTPKKYEFNTTYSVKLARGTRAEDGSFLPEDLIHSFTTVGNVQVEKITPRDGVEGADVRSPIIVYFDQDVEPESVESRLMIRPSTEGTFSLAGRVMTFTPNKPLLYGTAYTVLVGKGIKGVEGLASVTDFTSTFVTEPESVMLSVPLLLQQRALSCEVAALRMALAFRGITVNETTLLNQIGTDPTAHRGNTWGNPYEAFVGSVDGKQMRTGYGVYWGPIARAANNYLKAAEFSGWPKARVFEEIKNGNPVILWTYSANGEQSYWFTPKGERIFAIAGEHTVVIVGFVGSAEDPDQVIVNDPLEGRVYWSRETFGRKFAAFVGSGVVVY